MPGKDLPGNYSRKGHFIDEESEIQKVRVAQPNKKGKKGLYSIDHTWDFSSQPKWEKTMGNNPVM